MALPSARREFRIALSHVPRGLTREDSVILAQHPSENEEHVVLRVLAETVRYSFVCDPDGNHIEISQRASLTGGHL